MLVLDEALERLRGIHERPARAVELRFFGGLKAQEIAELMQVSRRTIVNDLSLARAWLIAELGQYQASG